MVLHRPVEPATVLGTYIEAANKLHTTLRATVPDPEKKADGFKQLETHLRNSIRILNDLVFGLPLDQREPFRVGVQELQEINSQCKRPVEAVWTERQ